MAKNKKFSKRKQNDAFNEKPTNGGTKYTTAALYIPVDISDKIRVEVTAVIQSIKFDKISFPLSAYRKDINTQENEQDDRVSTVGYIHKFDLESNTFQTVIFNGSKSVIDTFKNPIVVPIITTYKESLGTIIKLVIKDAGELNMDPEDEETATAETTEEADARYNEYDTKAVLVTEDEDETPSESEELEVDPDEVQSAPNEHPVSNVVSGRAVN